MNPITKPVQPHFFIYSKPILAQNSAFEGGRGIKQVHIRYLAIEAIDPCWGLHYQEAILGFQTGKAA